MSNSTGTYTSKTRENPRLSLNSFAEYLCTTKAAQRTKILMDAKFPNTFKNSYYKAACRAIAAFLKSKYDVGILHEWIRRIEAKEAKTERKKTQRKYAVLMLQTVLNNVNDLPDLKDFDLIVPRSNAAKSMFLEGVEIIIFPDLLIVGKVKNKPVLGGIKIHLGIEPMSQKMGVKAATLLRYFLGNHSGLENSSDADYKWCYSFDVFSNSWVASPSTHSGVMKDAVTNCKEIRDRWPALEKPPRKTKS